MFDVLLGVMLDGMLDVILGVMLNECLNIKQVSCWVVDCFLRFVACSVSCLLSCWES